MFVVCYTGSLQMTKLSVFCYTLLYIHTPSSELKEKRSHQSLQRVQLGTLNVRVYLLDEERQQELRTMIKNTSPLKLAGCQMLTHVNKEKDRNRFFFLYLGELRSPGENGPQRLNQLLFGDAVGVVRRLQWEEERKMIYKQLNISKYMMSRKNNTIQSSMG